MWNKWILISGFPQKKICLGNFFTYTVLSQALPKKLEPEFKEWTIFWHTWKENFENMTFRWKLISRWINCGIERKICLLPSTRKSLQNGGKEHVLADAKTSYVYSFVPYYAKILTDCLINENCSAFIQFKTFGTWCCQISCIYPLFLYKSHTRKGTTRSEMLFNRRYHDK